MSRQKAPSVVEASLQSLGVVVLIAAVGMAVVFPTVSAYYNHVFSPFYWEETAAPTQPTSRPMVGEFPVPPGYECRPLQEEYVVCRPIQAEGVGVASFAYPAPSYSVEVSGR